MFSAFHSLVSGGKEQRLLVEETFLLNKMKRDRNRPTRLVKRLRRSARSNVQCVLVIFEWLPSQTKARLSRPWPNSIFETRSFIRIRAIPLFRGGSSLIRIRVNWLAPTLQCILAGRNAPSVLFSNIRSWSLVIVRPRMRAVLGSSPLSTRSRGGTASVTAAAAAAAISPGSLWKVKAEPLDLDFAPPTGVLLYCDRLSIWILFVITRFGVYSPKNVPTTTVHRRVRKRMCHLLLGLAPQNAKKAPIQSWRFDLISPVFLSRFYCVSHIYSPFTFYCIYLWIKITTRLDH